MKKFMVVSGFLGSGKTTTMMTLTKRFNEKFGKAAMISNDLGSGELIDCRYSKMNGCSSTELTGECICYQTENLVDRLRRLFNYEKNEIVMSDIPGFGFGALEHVYHKLNREYAEEFQFAPFTVVTDPQRLKMIMTDGENLNLPHQLKYILKAQLDEADVIILNKIDLLSETEKEKYIAFLTENYPHIPIFAISAKEDMGIDQFIEHIIKNDASMHNPDIGYGSSEFVAAMGEISEYNTQYYTKICCDDFDGNEYLEYLADEIRKGLKNNGKNIPHLKLFTVTENGEFARISLLGIDYPVQFDAKLTSRLESMPVVINTSAACSSKVLDKVISEAIESVSKAFNQEVIIFYKECFGITDKGRI